MTIEFQSLIDADTIRGARGEAQQRLANEATADAVEQINTAVRAVIGRSNEIENSISADGAILIPDSVVTEPGAAFINDTSAGLFRAGTTGDESWHLVADGEKALSIDAALQGGHAVVSINDTYDVDVAVLGGLASMLDISGNLNLDTPTQDVDASAAALNVAPAGIATGDFGSAIFIVASARFVEPNITVGSVPITSAATVYIQSAPTEGDSNYALLIGADNAPIGIGAEGDATILYDGSNLVIDPRAVGSGVLRVEGFTEIVGHTGNAVVDLLTNDGSRRWRLQATQSGGAFIFRDATAGTNPFTVNATAPSNSFVVDGSGALVIGGNTPGSGHGSGDLRVTGDLQVDGTINGGMTGMIVMWGAAAAPSGWLLCDGSAVSRTTFADLFAVIGTTYGVGNGSTTFNVPDLRQRFPMGKAASGTGSTLGGTGGTIDHTHSDGSLAVASHTHGDGSLTVASHTHGSGTLVVDSHIHNFSSSSANFSLSAGGSPVVQSLNVDFEAPDVGSGVTDAASPDVTGTTAAAAPNVTGATGTANPPFVTVNFIVKT